MGNELKTNADIDKYVVARYYIDSLLDIKTAAGEIAKEESTGTWSDVPREKKVHKLYAAKVVMADKKNHTADVAFPVANFSQDIGGIANLLSTVAGNLFGLKKLRNVRLLDVGIPKSIIKEYKGPAFGIEGLRKILGTLETRRAHVGTIIKPKIGLSPKEQAKVFYEAAIGGIDAGKDDETLANQKFCPIFERTRAIREIIDKVKSQTGRNVLYAINITDRADRIVNTAEKAVKQGANLIMVDAVCTGLSSLQAVREANFKVPILVHRAGHAAFDKNPKHGINFKVIAKLCRMLGGDLIHTGGLGKMSGEWHEIKDSNNSLKSEWHGLKPAMPVASGGLHPGLIEKNINKFGSDIQIQAGGGVHSHPLGTRAGAAAMRQAVEAVAKGISVAEYSKTHKELRIALKTFGKMND